MSYRDISAHIKEMYDTEVSHKIIPDIKSWQHRPLESVYCLVWLDAMFYKVKLDGQIQRRALYNVLGVNKEGYKEVLGMYVCEREGANFWLGVLTDLKQRGLEDILIGCTDNLKGFTEAILSIFPKTQLPTLHCPPDPQFTQVCGFQRPKGVPWGFKAGLSGHQ